MSNELLLQNSKKRGRKKANRTQADTAIELGISQQSVSNAMQAVKLMKHFPELSKFNTTITLKAWRLVKSGSDIVPEDLEVREAWLIIIKGISKIYGGA